MATVDRNWADCDRQVRTQIAQYADVDDMHEDSPAGHFLGGILTRRLREVFGADTVTEVIATALTAAVERTGISEVLSLGSGYGVREIEIMEFARDRRLAPFRISCLELSPLLVEKTRETARQRGLEQFTRAGCGGSQSAAAGEPAGRRMPGASFAASSG